MKTLTDIIYKYKDAKFSYRDSLDCAAFCANIVSEFKGIEINFKDVEDYKDPKGVNRWLEKMGCKNLEDAPSAYLGVERKPISEVKLGDIVYYINEDNIGIFGVCNGVRAYFLQEGSGLTTRDINDCLYCWSVE